MKMKGRCRRSDSGRLSLARSAALFLLSVGVCVSAVAAPPPRPLAEAPRQPLTIEQAVQLALARNSDVRSAENALRAAEAARRVAVGKLSPQIRALSWYEVFPTKEALLLPRHMDVPSLSDVAAPTPMQSMQNMLNFQSAQFQDQVFNVGLGLSWRLYSGGQLQAAVEGAGAEIGAARYHADRVRQMLAFGVIQTYLGIGVAERSERAVQASIRHLRDSGADLQEFVRVGKRPRLDLLRVQARLAQTEQLLADVQAALQTERGNLRRLLDLDPSGPALALAPGGAIEAPSEPPPIATAIAEALGRRPDYLALQSQLEAQRARLHVAQGANRPQVDLAARVWEAHGNHTGGPISTWAPDSQITLSASIPLFTGGTLRAEADRANAGLMQAEDRLASLSQQVRQDVVQAYVGLSAARAKVLAAEGAVRAADEAYRVEREKFIVGAGTVTDLLDAQAADLSAQTASYQARAALGVAAARLRLAIGTLGVQASGASTSAR